MTISNSFYRTSIKGLILNKDKQFLLCREDNGYWDFPGGGLDFGEDVETCLKREINEEMGLSVTSISQFPNYFITFTDLKGVWKINIFYEVTVKDLLFTPSNECVEIKFFDKESAKTENVFPSVNLFLEKFDPSRH